MKKSIVLIGLLFLFISIVTAQTTTIVLETNFDGEVVYGEIDSLIAKIQDGKSVRIGWQLDFDQDGESDLEHWIDGEFISVLNGHVFNQIAPIYRQVPNLEIPQVQIIPSEMKWTAIIGTNGMLISRFIYPDLHLVEDERIRERLKKTLEIEERIVATMWAISE